VTFDYSHISLPVTEIIPEVQAGLVSHTSIIIGAPPGAGKSTVLPLALRNETFLKGKKIIMLEPRRLAARSIALRMAELLGEPVGQSVGYRIRFENKVSEYTRIEVVTEGILTRMLQADNALEEYGLVIFDEFHERNIQADLAMALCREVQQVLRPDLRIIVMSATLNIPQLQKMLNALVIESRGKQFPVEVIYENDADEFFLAELVSQAVTRSVKKHDGDVLAFLPGEGEIRKCEDLLRKLIPDFKIHPLYGMLPHQEQYAAIMPNRNGQRKVVLATSIAETSLTIEGIRIVIDCGFTRRSKFDPPSGLSRLETVRISKDAADQRAGRAGRIDSGVCIRLWTRATHERLSEHRVPEIMEADLCSLVLEVSKWGTQDIKQMGFLSLPTDSTIQYAYDTLNELGALNENKITAHGNQIHKMSCHPRIAHMLLLADTISMKQLACDVAAVLEERDPLPKESGIDLNLRVEALRRSRSQGALNQKYKRIEKHSQLYRIQLNVGADDGVVDPYATGLLLAYAYPERIASARPGNNAQFQLANGKVAAIGHADDLAHEPWISVANMDLRSGLGKIFLAAPLNPKDLIDLVKERQNISWDSRKRELVCLTEQKIGSIVLSAKPLLHPDPVIVEDVISKALKDDGEKLLDFTDKFLQLQNRISSLRIWNPSDNWPDVSTEYLLNNVKEWLGIFLSQIRKAEDLKRINLFECLLHSLPWEQQQQLELWTPSKLEVPSGSKIGIAYFNNGASPVISVRLQEVFGLADTPTVNNGRIKTVLHLLSPGYKPVQVTNDLKSFWNQTYHEVKKELQRRYPKHAWPDDPWSAKAVAKGRSIK
jgi:ATP-dependent helicase HrpB